MQRSGYFSLKGALLGSAAFVATVLSSPGAMAQDCVDTGFAVGGLAEVGELAASVASSVATSISSLNTVFLTQQTSAFVAAPSGVAPGTQGGGVWVRGVGGEAKVSSQSTTNLTLGSALANENGTIHCASRERIEFAGVQVGQDISRLNLMGYNVHIGTTAGYLEAKSKELNGRGTFENKIEVPFVGAYGVITKDRFFADLNVRSDFYNMKLQDPTQSLFNQDVTATGFSVSAGAGYNMDLGSGWFLEPSAGGLYSWTKIDQFSSVGLPPPHPARGISGTLSFDTVTSAIGRATLRMGRNFTAGNLALQPFLTASVFHDFGADVKSRFQSCPSCVFVNPAVGAGVPAAVDAQTQTSRVGTYGQFSAGIAGQLLNTGWLGFVRGDYRTGDDIEGWTLNGGLRYQYTPEPQVPVFSKGPTPPMVAPVYWTGLYLGGSFGAAYGTADVGFTNLTSVDTSVTGWLGGGQVGYNYQFGPYVAGIEGDFGSTNIKGMETCGSSTGLNVRGAPVAFSPFFMTCGSELDWVATAAARFGVTWDRALFYVKAGAAWAEESLVVDCINAPFNTPSPRGRKCRNLAGTLINGLEVSDTRTGWMVGYGSEFALTPNWSAKAEFKYMDFGSQDYTASDGSRLTSDLQVSTVTVGINYRFSAAPLLARY